MVIQIDLLDNINLRHDLKKKRRKKQFLSCMYDDKITFGLS